MFVLLVKANRFNPRSRVGNDGGGGGTTGQPKKGFNPRSRVGNDAPDGNSHAGTA